MFFKRAFIATAVALAAFGGSTGTHAAGLEFCVTDTYSTPPGVLGQNQVACNGVVDAAGQTGFKSDELQGGYAEKIRVGPGPGPLGLGFDALIVAQWDSFNLDAQTVLNTGLNSTFGLYALVTASGYLTGPESFKATGATLQVFLNTDGANTFGLSSIGMVDHDANPLTPDIWEYQGDPGADTLLASTSTLLSGSGTTQQTGGDDGFEVLFGEFSLTAAGQNFFIAPRPFHLVIRSDGDINADNPIVAAGIFEIEGDLSAEFRAVPEPTSLALAGLALLGLGVAKRRAAKR